MKQAIHEKIDNNNTYVIETNNPNTSTKDMIKNMDMINNSMYHQID